MLTHSSKLNSKFKGENPDDIPNGTKIDPIVLQYLKLSPSNTKTAVGQ